VSIAVVIPALNEAAGITEAIESAAGCNVDLELVVVDGGSIDDTRSRARASGARVLESRAGRGCQLQAGVEVTRGDPVVFLHADTRLPSGWDAAVLEALKRPDTVGGAFRLRMDGPGWGLRLLEWGVRARVAILSLPYGDQAIFVRREALQAMGGVPDVVVMEDLDLVAKMKERGRIEELSLEVATSARRYLAAGVGWTFLRHALALSAWQWGVDRVRVARWLER
jgi:rSAM/selenodomain-associated transferase 2